MADWPIAGMSNFGYPELGLRITREGPRVLVSRYEDGKETRRTKSAAIPRRFFEPWHLTRTDMDAVLDFYESVGTGTTFSKLLLDPISGANFLTDVVNARFAAPPSITQIGPNWYEVTLEFLEVL